MAVEARQMNLETCNEGFLLDPLEWTPEVAEELARREGIELTEDHWKVLKFMRDFYGEHRIAADARFVIKYLAEDLGKGRQARSELYRLFPYGYMQQACKVAGMRRPRAWSTG